MGQCECSLYTISLDDSERCKNTATRELINEEGKSISLCNDCAKVVIRLYGYKEVKQNALHNN